jgi:hypothetical protein
VGCNSSGALVTGAPSRPTSAWSRRGTPRGSPTALDVYSGNERMQHTSVLQTDTLLGSNYGVPFSQKHLAGSWGTIKFWKTGYEYLGWCQGSLGYTWFQRHLCQHEYTRNRYFLQNTHWGSFGSQAFGTATIRLEREMQRLEAEQRRQEALSNVKLRLKDDGSMDVEDAFGNPLSRADMRLLWEQKEDLIREWLKTNADEINGDVELLTRIHEDTPNANADPEYIQDYPDYWTQGETLDDLKDHLRDLSHDLTCGALPGIRKVDEWVVS